MPIVDCVVTCNVEQTPRLRQLESIFDVPLADANSRSWTCDVPIEDDTWNVGLIVGPSGAGKSICATELFGKARRVHKWPRDKAIIDGFSANVGIREIADICQAVGFNTIPSWCRPFRVLSTGEQFRVNLAYALLTYNDPVVVDEFTSVVDRQVAQIASHAVQRYVRKNNRQFVAVSCHYDIIDWLQPDWIFEPQTMKFKRRRLRRRPQLNVTVGRVDYELWQTFAPFHYMSAKLNKAARCFCLFVNGRAASFAGVLHRPHSKVNDIKGVSRLVTLPDWQGMGLAFVLLEKLGGAYRRKGYRFRMYPAHPPLVRSFMRSKTWRQKKKSGMYASRSRGMSGAFGGRPCAVFEYIGKILSERKATLLLD